MLCYNELGNTFRHILHILLKNTRKLNILTHNKKCRVDFYKEIPCMLNHLLN